MQNVKVCIRGWLTYFGIVSMKTTIANERLVQAGYYSILGRYESLHLCYHARWCERSARKRASYSIS